MWWKLQSISQAVPGFAPPNLNSFPNTFDQPTYYKWNFEVERSLGARMMLSFNYSGMHGSHIPIGDEGLNAYCPPSACPNGFAAPSPRRQTPPLGQVPQYLSAGTASYNGLSVSLQRQPSSGLAFNVNYTWSHALDDVSDGGVTNLPFGILATNVSEYHRTAEPLQYSWQLRERGLRPSALFQRDFAVLRCIASCWAPVGSEPGFRGLDTVE